MTSVEFMNLFFGPRNKPNREQTMKHYGISSFSGIPAKRLGWTGFVNALGDKFNLDVRNFSCEARFIDALASQLSRQ